MDPDMGLPAAENGCIYFKKFQPLIEQAFTLQGTKAVVLVIDSPGGSPVQSSLIGSYIRRRAEESKIPVYAIVEEYAASGGYWLACAADEIYIDKSSNVGCIGVISLGVGIVEMMRKLGLEPRILTTAEHKADRYPELEMDETQVKELKGKLTKTHKLFTDWVRQRRPKIKEEDTKELFSGRVFVGEEAVSLHLADGMENLAGMLLKKFKCNQIDVVEIRTKKEPDTLLDVLAPFFRNSSRVLDKLSFLLDLLASRSSEVGVYPCTTNRILLYPNNAKVL